jgi:hypothetical protein
LPFFFESDNGSNLGRQSPKSWALFWGHHPPDSVHLQIPSHTYTIHHAITPCHHTRSASRSGQSKTAWNTLILTISEATESIVELSATYASCSCLFRRSNHPVNSRRLSLENANYPMPKPVSACKVADSFWWASGVHTLSKSPGSEYRAWHSTTRGQNKQACSSKSCEDI